MRLLLPAVLLALSCLPAAAQEQPAAAPSSAPPRGLRLSTPSACPGYTLLAPLRSRTTYLIDLAGAVVHTWASDAVPGDSAYLLDDGSVLRCAQVTDNPLFHGGGIGGRVQRIAWDGTVTWDFTLSSDERMHHHDVAPMPNGDVLLVAWERLFRADAVALGRDPGSVGAEGLWPDSVLEVEPLPPSGARVVWEWHASDHLVQDRDPEKPGYGAVPDAPGRIDVNADLRSAPPPGREELEREMRALGYAAGASEGGGEDVSGKADWLHVNSVDYDARDDLVLLSTRTLGEVWIIDHSTTTAEAAGASGGRYGHGGELLWRWGNPRDYGAGADAERWLFGPHDAHWIPAGLPGAGHVLVFDNGLDRPEGAWSRVLEIALPFDPERGFERAPGKAFGPAAPVWSYVAKPPESFYSGFLSGAQRLPNGDTLVCSGAEGRVFEVAPSGALVWDYSNPFGGEAAASLGGAAPPDGLPIAIEPKALFRATRVSPDHPALAGRL